MRGWQADRRVCEIDFEQNLQLCYQIARSINKKAGYIDKNSSDLGGKQGKRDLSVQF